MVDFQHKKPSTKQKEELFVAGIREYKHNLFRMAKSILHHDAEAEDAVGETLCKAYSKLGSLRSPDSFKPWVMKILINECYAAAKRRNRVDYHSDMDEENNFRLNVRADIAENSGDTRQELWTAVSQLDREFRTVVILFFYEDLSIKETAKILKLPEGTVKSRLARAKQKLKVLLESGGGLETEKARDTKGEPDKKRDPYTEGGIIDGSF